MRTDEKQGVYYHFLDEVSTILELKRCALALTFGSTPKAGEIAQRRKQFLLLLLPGYLTGFLSSGNILPAEKRNGKFD